MFISESQVAIGQSICQLAGQCQVIAYPPKSVIDLLNKITASGKFPFSGVEKQLLAVQKIYSEGIAHLRKFERKDREKIRQVILAQTQFHRYSSFLPIFDREIEKMQNHLQEGHEKVKKLQHRLTKGIGDKVDQRNKKETILIDNTLLRTELNQMKNLREEVAKRCQQAFVNANLARSKLAKSSQKMDMDVFKDFEALIAEREKIKAQFFLANKWPFLLVDCKVQNAFDAILRATTPPPISCWQQFCCCFNFL